jgi:hypothetical protein
VYVVHGDQGVAVSGWPRVGRAQLAWRQRYECGMWGAVERRRNSCKLCRSVDPAPKAVSGAQCCTPLRHSPYQPS